MNHLDWPFDHSKEIECKNIRFYSRRNSWKFEHNLFLFIDLLVFRFKNKWNFKTKLKKIMWTHIFIRFVVLALDYSEDLEWKKVSGMWFFLRSLESSMAKTIPKKTFKDHIRFFIFLPSLAFVSKRNNWAFNKKYK